MVLGAQRMLRAPRHLVLDEPTSSLDLHHQLVILQQLKTYTREWQAIAVMALHDLTRGARFCDWLILVKGGCAIACRPTADILSGESIDDCWNVSAEVLHAIDGCAVIVLQEHCASIGNGVQ